MTPRPLHPLEENSRNRIVLDALATLPRARLMEFAKRAVRIHPDLATPFIAAAFRAATKWKTK